MNNIKLVVNDDGLRGSEIENQGEESQILRLAGLSVGSFVQLISMDQKTCKVDVYHKVKGRGTFYFVNGSLYDAICGNLESEEAAVEMIAWEDVSIITNNNIHAKDIGKKIESGLMSLLMESSRRKDESEWSEQHKSEKHTEYDEDSTELPKFNQINEKQNLTSPVNNSKTGNESITGNINESGINVPAVKNQNKLSIFIDILEKMKGIHEYCVFDETDAPQFKSRKSSAIMNMAPSFYFNLTDNLRDLVDGGSLKYLSFNTKGGVRYLLIHINKLYAVVGLNPGIKPDDFLKSISFERQ